MSQELSTIVLEALDSEDPNLLRAGCIMAGQMALAQSERGLIKALGHKAWQIQAEAARALGKLAAPGAASFLRRLLKAGDADVRQKVLAAAAAPKSAAAPEEGEAHSEVKRAAAVALGQTDPKVAEEALAGALASGQANLMVAAMTGLANLESKGGLDAMHSALGHEDPAVRSAAVAALGRLRDREAVQGLVDLLQDPEATVRRETVIALNHLKDASAVGPLGELLADSDAGVRKVAAIALGNTRHKAMEVIGPLRKGLGDRDPGVREACCKALANVKAPEVLEAMLPLLGDSHEAVQRTAAQAVVVLAQQREQPDYDFNS